MNVVLCPILKDGTVHDVNVDNEFLQDVIPMTVELYKKAGFHSPWISYVVLLDNVPVGAGAFKSAPVNGRVEIAYFTFPKFENKGIGTQTVTSLIDIAKKHDPTIQIFAQTLPEDNASGHILQKLHFVKTKEVMHPEDGKVWEWELHDNEY
jgi:[ribosomal protein S5]-alanine N-acetyltransferase